MNGGVSNIKVVEYDKNDGGLIWDDYVDNHERGMLAHKYFWKGLINECFGHNSYYLVAMSDVEKICGVLPVVHLKSLLFGNYMVSMPYLNYGGALAETEAIEQLLMEKAGELAGGKTSQSIEFRDCIPRDSGWPTKTEKVSMLLDLPGTAEELGKTIGSKRRSQIKRPQREAPEIFVGKDELLDDFYAVFSENMRDLGTPVYGKEFFSAILSGLNDSCNLVVIKLNGKPVASAFLLSYKNVMEIPWASTLREVNNISMNMLLYWEVLRFAIERGMAQFDFGRSSQDAGTYRFKKQWGAQPKQLYWHYWLEVGGSLPALNPDNPKYHLMIESWKKLPVWLTQKIGPMVVKNLP